MTFIETPIFTRLVRKLLGEESYRQLQIHLTYQPDTGKVIKGSGGLRKIRWKQSGRGKRGGVRVIYYWFINSETMMMLYIYPKSSQSNLSPKQLKELRTIIEKEYHEKRKI